MRRRLIPVNVVIASLLFILLSLEPDRNVPRTAVMERGKEIYSQKCSSCHGQDGKGFAHETSSLSKAKSVMGPRAQLIKFIVDSSTVPVKGNSFHRNMPSYKELDDEQLSDVITYVRNSFGNTAKPVTPSDIKRARSLKKS